MTRQELLSKILENHNRLSQIEVHSDGAILMGETLLDLRRLLSRLQTESIEEESSN